MIYLVSVSDAPVLRIDAQNDGEAQDKLLEYVRKSGHYPEFRSFIDERINLLDLMSILTEEYDISNSDYDTLMELLEQGVLTDITSTTFESIDSDLVNYFQETIIDEWMLVGLDHLFKFFDITELDKLPLI